MSDTEGFYTTTLESQSQESAPEGASADAEKDETLIEEPQAQEQSDSQPTEQDAPSDPLGLGENIQADPDPYEFVMPEGMSLDEGLVATFTPVMRANGLTQEQAQSLADTLAAHFQDQGLVAQQDATAQKQAQWSELERDPDYGGANLEQTVKYAEAAALRWGNPDLIEAVKSSGLNTHPEFVKMLARIGKQSQISDIKLPTGPSGSASKTTVADIYTNTDFAAVKS